MEYKKRRRRPPDPRLSENYLKLLKEDRRLKEGTSCLLKPFPFNDTPKSCRMQKPEGSQGNFLEPKPKQSVSKSLKSKEYILVVGFPSATTDEQLRRLFQYVATITNLLEKQPNPFLHERFHAEVMEIGVTEGPRIT